MATTEPSPIQTEHDEVCLEACCCLCESIDQLVISGGPGKSPNPQFVPLGCALKGILKDWSRTT
jgi:hypothetical protein